MRRIYSEKRRTTRLTNLKFIVPPKVRRCGNRRWAGRLERPHIHTHKHTFSFSGPRVIGSATRGIDPLPFHSKTLARSLISVSSLSSRKRAALIVPANLPGLNEFDRFAYLAIAAHLNLSFLTVLPFERCTLEVLNVQSSTLSCAILLAVKLRRLLPPSLRILFDRKLSMQ